MISLLITWVIMLAFRRKAIKEDLDYLKSQPKETRKKLMLLMLAAGILITGNWFSFIYATNHVSLKSAAFAYMVCPLTTAAAGYFILKEDLTKIKLIALGIAVVSILILTKGAFIDVAWSVFIAAFYTFHVIIQRVVKQIDRFNMLGVQLIISAILMLPLFIYHYDGLPADTGFWINMFVIAILFTIIPLFLSMYALIGLSSSTLGIIIYINPVVSFAVAFFYFNEGVNVLQLIAYSLLIVAVITFNSALINDLYKKSVSARRNI